MTKSETIAAIADDSGNSKAAVEAVLDTFVEHVQRTLKKGGEVSLPGLGKFKVAKRAARTARNPQTGDPVKVAAKRVPKFSPAQDLKAAVAK